MISSLPLRFSSSAASIILFFLLMIGAHALHAQTPAMMAGQADESSEQQEGSAQEGDQAAESEPKLDLGLSEAIAFDSFVDRWEFQFNQWLAELGWAESVSGKVVMTAIVVTVALIFLFLVKVILKYIRKKVISLAVKLHMSESNVNFLFSALYYLFGAVIVLMDLIGLGIVWRIGIERVVTSDFVISLFTNLISLYLLVLVAILILQISGALIESIFHRWGAASESRAKTLMPIAKNTVFAVLITMFTLVVLSEIGIDVMPLLAGAGVVGFAVGFGAQAIIKDILTGFIIILEDLIQVGDVARVAGKVGLVERITIRKVQLRDLGGSVFTVPFSEISIVENLTKDFSCTVFDVGVAYREDVDQVMTLMRQVGDDLEADESFKDDIIDSLEIFGLDQFGDSALVIKARYKTKPLKQWNIAREFNRRLKICFDQHNIEIPFPHQTIYFGEDKDGSAPPLQVKQIAQAKAAANQDGDISTAQLDATAAKQNNGKQSESEKISASSRRVGPEDGGHE